MVRFAVIFFIYCTKLSFSLLFIVERHICLVPYVKVKRSSLRLAVLRFKLVWVLSHPVRMHHCITQLNYGIVASVWLLGLSRTLPSSSTFIQRSPIAEQEYLFSYLLLFLFVVVISISFLSCCFIYFF